MPASVRSMVMAGLTAAMLGAFSSQTAFAHGDCRAAAATLRESLELVGEAMIDGRPAQVPVEVRRAEIWWSDHRQAFGPPPAADSMMAALDAAARRGADLEAAGNAVSTALATFRWCGAPFTDAERLFVLDVTGMTAWLRARGVSLDWPPAVRAHVQTLAKHLVRAKRPRLAARLRASVAVAMKTPRSPQGDVRAAKALLDLVDVVEKVLR